MIFPDVVLLTKYRSQLKKIGGAFLGYVNRTYNERKNKNTRRASCADHHRM